MDEAPRPCPSGLFFHIIGAHENSARQRQLGTGSCSCDTMLSSTSGCHNILQAHAFGNHRLRNSVVHLVCSTMIQILPLEVYRDQPVYPKTHPLDQMKITFYYLLDTGVGCWDLDHHQGELPQFRCQIWSHSHHL
ncbi:hypothetical protein SADUNF_Sadunf11G0011700 [Salix dunnii]|uniref:Uncharacterized protein n=1 Tax=Salix dunnii TaxID=1413687 RepID=A0A835JPF5_9ROSI|nr:hypothetical protein SADUNF_Sadunf11G0011700 [Salix dunnii]